MEILVVLNDDSQRDIRFLVVLSEMSLRTRVMELMKEKRVKAAFEIVLKHAQVKCYLAPGSSLFFAPEMTFVEDLL